MYHVIGLKQTSGINVTLKAAKHYVGVAVNWEEKHRRHNNLDFEVFIGIKRP